MKQSTATEKSFSFIQRLKEISMFFQRKDEVHKTMRRLAKLLDKANIAYAVVGGMAVNAHKHRRTTDDVDILLTPEGLKIFRSRFVERNYASVPGRPRRFLDQKNDVGVDILVTGHFPGSGDPGPVAFPDPAEVAQDIQSIRVVDLPTLVQLKLAARRVKDSSDVIELIRVNNLDESFQDRIHPSVRRHYLECLDEKSREDEYQARQDQRPD